MGVLSKPRVDGLLQFLNDAGMAAADNFSKIVRELLRLKYAVLTQRSFPRASRPVVSPL